MGDFIFLSTAGILSVEKVTEWRCSTGRKKNGESRKLFCEQKKKETGETQPGRLQFSGHGANVGLRQEWVCGEGQGGDGVGKEGRGWG